MIYLIAGGGEDLDRYCVDRGLTTHDLRDRSRFCVIMNEHNARGHRPKQDDEIVYLGGSWEAYSYLHQARDLKR